VIAATSPAFESLRAHIAESLKGSSAAVTPGRGKSRVRGFLVAAQVALSLLIVGEGGVFARAQLHYFSYDPGFETKQVITVTLGSVVAGYTASVGFYQELDSRVRAL